MVIRESDARDIIKNLIENIKRGIDSTINYFIEKSIYIINY